jgi:hypothetical protein
MMCFLCMISMLVISDTHGVQAGVLEVELNVRVNVKLNVKFYNHFSISRM